MLLQWAEPADRYYEAGIDRVVLFVEGQNGVAWSGVTEISENPSGGDPEPRYIDGVKLQTRASMEEFRGTIEAFYSPEEFDACDGALEAASGVFVRQQERKPFALSFRTKLVNAEDPSIPRYKIHIVYNALATPSARNYQTIGDSLEPITLSWDFTTRPKPYPELLPTAHISVDTAQSDPAIISIIEGFLYGSDTNESTLLLPEDIFVLFGGIAAYGLVVTDLGGGLFDISGPDEHVELIATDIYKITGHGGFEYEADVATISS